MRRLTWKRLRPLIRDPRNLIRLIPAKGTRVNCCSRQSVRADRICYSIRRLTSHVLF
ncbi:unnamed protein product [Klebsiella pneumoniae]|nr:unnamed protein product [Klebsiella pneumoniae]